MRVATLFSHSTKETQHDHQPHVPPNHRPLPALRRTPSHTMPARRTDAVRWSGDRGCAGDVRSG